MVQKPINVNQDLLGYRLKERIGAGGYGEVWSAEAPGGIMKAVKIVFGYHDERRAQNELRSLDRVKALRHPFLLNLERIDVVDGQLVIITELADKSMADEFNDFVLKGEPGIPRQYLLNQLREAADALDYISEKHSLQHLDVKPENLLLVGRHIKVADFGLVKDLQDVSQSLMGGLTPAYAAPELFDGRPSNTSDQYSLAIVFQEMLTGQRPFPGTTPAALAAQHMNGKPNLRPLPKSDQLVIAKALSKDPGVRFPNCVAMVEELISRHSVNTKAPVRKAAPARRVQDTESKEIKVRNQLLPTEATQLIDNSIYQDIAEEFIDSPDCSALPSTVRPTLFLGIGNSANQIIRELRQKMIERFGSMESIPSIKMLCMDTDRQELTNLSRVNDGYDLTAGETLALPLRKPEEYRSRQKSILNWLSRRWIYNVPRTLRTEGIRPLGRLALIDNFESVYEQLQTSIEQLGKPELLAKTAESIGMEPGKVEPDVFIVSSVSGGSGSGMMNDLAYVAKIVLSEFGKPRDRIHGIMLHSTSSTAGDPGLAATNSFAFLTELRHFTQFGYPGDDSQGLPDLPNEAPFESNYFLNLGNDLQPKELEEKFNNIAEYLFLNSCSPSNKFSRQCRKLEEEIEHFALRSIGVGACGLSNTDAYQSLVESLCRQLLQKWTQGDGDSLTMATSVFESFDASGLEPSQIKSDIAQSTKEYLEGEEFQAYRNRIFDTFRNPHSITRVELIERTESIFGPREGKTLGATPEICKLANQKVVEVADEISPQIDKLLQGMTKHERLDLSACLRASVEFENCFTSRRARIREASEQIYAKVEQLEEALILWFDKSQSRKQEQAPLESIVSGYIEANLEEFHLRNADQLLQILGRRVSSQSEQFQHYISQLNSAISVRFQEEAEFQSSSEIESAFANQLREQLPRLIGATELKLFHDLIDVQGGYVSALEDQNCINYLIPETLRTVAQTELAHATRRMDIESIVGQLEGGEEAINQWVKSIANQAAIYQDECGGKVRQAIVIPADAESESISERFINDDQPRKEVVKGTFGDIALISEAEDVPLANVAFRLLQFRPDCLELTKRLHTRSDVDWLSLEDIL